MPQSARLSAGGGGQKLNGQCPNAPSMNLRKASLTSLDLTRHFDLSFKLMISFGDHRCELNIHSHDDCLQSPPSFILTFLNLTLDGAPQQSIGQRSAGGKYFISSSGIVRVSPVLSFDLLTADVDQSLLLRLHYQQISDRLGGGEDGQYCRFCHLLLRRRRGVTISWL